MTDSSATLEPMIALEARAAALRDVVKHIGVLSEQIDPTADTATACEALLTAWLGLSSWLDCAIEEAAHEVALQASLRSRF